MKLEYDFDIWGNVHISVYRGAKVWGVCLAKDSDLNAPLPCIWDGETEITPVSLPEEVKVEILAKWAQVEG